jgi:hypothetical protein
LEYLEPEGRGGTDLVAAISFDKSLSKRDLREIISAAAEAIDLPPTSGEMSTRRLVTKSPGAVRAPGSSVWTLREFLINYRKSLGDEEWYVDLYVVTAFGLFQGSSHLRHGEEEDQRKAERFLQKMRQICQANRARTRCKVIV